MTSFPSPRGSLPVVIYLNGHGSEELEDSVETELSETLDSL